MASVGNGPLEPELLILVGVDAFHDMLQGNMVVSKNKQFNILKILVH